MVARVASFEGVDLAKARGMLDDVEAVLRPLVEGLPGYRGTLDLVSGNGKQLSVAFFDSEENAAAAEHVFDEDMPRALGAIFESWEGRRVSVDRYEVLVDQRG
jgi:hypothetical protein